MRDVICECPLTCDAHSARFLDVFEPGDDFALNNELDANSELNSFFDHKFLKNKIINFVTRTFSLVKSRTIRHH